MAMTFAQLQDVTSRVVRELAAQQTQLETAKGTFTAIQTSLTAMQTTYGAWATDINALSAANPSDAAVTALKAEKNRLVAEFESTKTDATAMAAAINGA